MATSRVDRNRTVTCRSRSERNRSAHSEPRDCEVRFPYIIFFNGVSLRRSRLHHNSFSESQRTGHRRSIALPESGPQRGHAPAARFVLIAGSLVGYVKLARGAIANHEAVRDRLVIECVRVGGRGYHQECRCCGSIRVTDPQQRHS